VNNLISVGFKLLLVLLPIQAILGVYLVTQIGFSSWVLFWKELIVSLLMFIFLYQIFAQTKRIYSLKLLFPIFTAFLLSIFAVLNSVGRVGFKNIVLGFRFELFWLLFLSVFFVWSQNVKFDKLKSLIVDFGLIGFVPVNLISWLTIFFKQDKILGFFGFGSQKSGIFADVPLVHAVDGVGNTMARLSGTFTTPNHFAGYLVLMLPLLYMKYVSTKNSWLKVILILGAVDVFIFVGLSYARFAWLGLIMGLVILVLYKFLRPGLFKKFALVFALIIPIFVGVFAINIPEDILKSRFPSFLSKSDSTVFHARRTYAALDIITQKSGVLWRGYGLGSAGPAAKAEYVNLEELGIYKDNIQIALSKYLNPAEITISENWYLQLILNGGVFYAIGYVGFLIYLVKRSFLDLLFDRISIGNLLVFLALFSIMIGNLFLHLWENQTIAFYFGFLVVLLNLDNLKDGELIVDNSI
jgi:hypothetical protein